MASLPKKKGGVLYALDFGLIEFGPDGIRSAVTSEFHPSTIVPTYGAGRAGLIDEKERLKRYRRYVYEAGALDRPGKMVAGVIGSKVLEKERENAKFRDIKL